ncbi:MAG TPA: F0F1 ATP synthase subunit B [Terrimicrobiaceae bacterium]|nr:F0F1 ATP synthase subunit B [Terrimicrobiaceae bacterium]
MDVITEIFSNFGVTWSKFIAQIILFLIVYWVLNKYAFGPVLKMLAERRRRIEEGQHNAEKIKKQLAEAELRYQEVLRKAHDEATKLLDEARATSDAISQKQMQQAIKDAEGIIAKAQDTIVQERNKMVAEVKKEMVDLVVKTTSKVVGKVITPEDQERLSEETVKQIAA